jgi:hypothetical protein
MAKSISWASRAPGIWNRIQASSRQSWRRGDIKRLFEVKRATAQTLIKLIGEVHLVGGTHVLDRSSLLGFLEEVLAAPTVAEGVARRWLAAEPLRAAAASASCTPHCPPTSNRSWPAICHLPSRSNPARSSSPAPARDLWRNRLLAQALQNDLGTIQTMLDPPPRAPSVEQDELRVMFARLRQDERAWQLARQRA